MNDVRIFTLKVVVVGNSRRASLIMPRDEVVINVHVIMHDLAHLLQFWVMAALGTQVVVLVLMIQTNY